MRHSIKFILFAGLLLAARISSMAADFAANPASLGAIPDYPLGQPCYNEALYVNRDVTFTVTGMPTVAAADDIQIRNLTFSPAHTFAGDLVATLISPNGLSKMVVFGRIGASGPASAGYASDLAGPYSFDNSYSQQIWPAALSVAINQPVPAGQYRASYVGGDGSGEWDRDPAASFKTVVNTNGTWTLRFNDTCNGDTGGVSGVTLSIIHKTSNTLNHPNDFDGDGKTDLTIVRSAGALALTDTMGVGDDPADKTRFLRPTAQSAPGATQIQWWTRYSSVNSFSTNYWGLTTDQILAADFDGDGKADPTVFRPGAAGASDVGFYILQSSTNSYRFESFGQTGDVPTVVDDWDGDGKSDPAVYRSGNGANPQSYFYFRGSKNNPGQNITYVPFGLVGDVPFTGDFDGDGLLDPATQRNNGNGSATLYLRKSSNGTNFAIQWGFPTDVIVPTDFDGDGRTDLVATRNVTTAQGSQKWWYTSFATGSYSFRVFGIPGDYVCQGDYNGDGKADFGVWRPSDGNFYAADLNGNFSQITKWGKSGDYPVNNWNAH